MSSFQNWLNDRVGYLATAAIIAAIAGAIVSERRISTLEAQMTDMRLGLTTPMAKDTTERFETHKQRLDAHDRSLLEIHRELQDLAIGQGQIREALGQIRGHLGLQRQGASKSAEPPVVPESVSRPPLPPWKPAPPGVGG